MYIKQVSHFIKLLEKNKINGISPSAQIQHIRSDTLFNLVEFALVKIHSHKKHAKGSQNDRKNSPSETLRTKNKTFLYQKPGSTSLFPTLT